MSLGGEAEVCVIGGGPAGSTVARKLALLGHDVCLIERASFPRPHIGESLPPSVLPLLDAVGLREEVERAGFLRPERSIIRWSDATDHVKSRPGLPGFQVDRGQFDRLLLEAARDAGVRILQPCLVTQPPSRQGDAWSVPTRWSDRARDLRAAFLVDASGRHSVLRGKRTRYAPPTLALHAYWRDTGCVSPETRVEAGPHEWFWGAPLPDGTFNAVVFVDPQRCSRAGRAGIEALYRSLLASSTLLRVCLDGVPASRIRACDASTYFTDPAPDAHSIRVGEASFSIDPLSSQGVQIAMQSALQGGVVVHTLLACPPNAVAALEFHRTRQAETVTRNSEWATECYADHERFRAHEFWQQRAQQAHAPATQPVWQRNAPGLSADCHVELSDNARLVDTPAIKGDLIVTLPALVHPALDRPVAYLGDAEVAPLVRDISRGTTVRQAVSKWSQRLPLDASWQIMNWMWSQGIIVATRDG